MVDFVTQKVATANGTFELGPSPLASYSYAVDGNFGGGTVEVGYMSAGIFVKYADITGLTAAGQGVITCGQGRAIAFRVTAATSPNIQLLINLV